MKTFSQFITEDTHPHKVFVRDYSNGSDVDGNSKEWRSKELKAAVKQHEAQHDYNADKGVGFMFKHEHQAKAFTKHINGGKYKDLSASQDT